MNRIFQILLFCTLSFMTAGFAHAFTAERPVIPDFNNLDLQDDVFAGELQTHTAEPVLISLQAVQSVHVDNVSPETHTAAGDSLFEVLVARGNDISSGQYGDGESLLQLRGPDFIEALSTCDVAAMTGARGQGHLKAASLKPASVSLRTQDYPRAYALKQPDLYSG